MQIQVLNLGINMTQYYHETGTSNYGVDLILAIDMCCRSILIINSNYSSKILTNHPDDRSPSDWIDSFSIFLH